MKRSIDIIVSVLLLAILFPLIGIIAVIIRWRIGPPVLFRQLRPGYRGVPFYVYKFRTMKEACDVAGNPLPDSERLTPFGGWMRRLSLDELPQLFNVLTGQLSLVGPRPLLMEYLPYYTPDQARRHEVKPGVTGWAQINGRNAISWEEKFSFDVWYVDHRSAWLDLKILCLTFWRLLKREGINAEGHVTMPRFSGRCEKTGGS